jgi:hypothetical protein
MVNKIISAIFIYIFSLLATPTIFAQSVSITSPTSSGTFQTTNSSITLSGSVSASSLTWDNVNTPYGSPITFSGSTWTSGSIELKPGTNEILITAIQNGRTATAKLVVTRTLSGPNITNIRAAATSVPMYNKYEVKFDVQTVADNYLFTYNPAPPPGLTPKIGVTVEALITTPSGKTVVQPAFHSTETTMYGNPIDKNLYFSQSAAEFWAVRYSPQALGTHQVSLRVTDASGTKTVSAGSFTATNPVLDGFIGVSKDDWRYFEYSNGKIYWPLGPAWGWNYAQYAGTGHSFERPWMAGYGAFSTNFARWISSSEQGGNEGVKTIFSYDVRYPGHELSYPLFYPTGYRIWLPDWGTEESLFYARFKPNTDYQVKFRVKTENLAGPRNNSYPWGLTIKMHGFISHLETIDTFEKEVRSNLKLIDHIQTNRDWHTIISTIRTGNSASNGISIFLDNVTAGMAYVDELSVREKFSNGTLGGELIRNPKADQHTYVEHRPMAFFDWQLSEGEKYGIVFKYVVHDKNDWIFNRIRGSDGAWVPLNTPGAGYYLPENTKSIWLLQQWYRYLAARLGHSTSVHSWELNNEGTPDGVNHWTTTQNFARYMHQNDAHPHLANTSFWCCWRPNFWKDKVNYPDVDHADLHMYTTGGIAGDFSYDIAKGMIDTSTIIRNDSVGVPTILAETGLSGAASTQIQVTNPGIYFHNFLWTGLHPGALFSPNYWFKSHMNYISRLEISKAFYQFIKDVDLNKGGYSELNQTVSNSKLRVVGQKNITKGKVLLWVQNDDYTWKKYMDGVRTYQSGTITFNMGSGSKSYTIETWNTNTGVVSKTESRSSDGSGNLSIPINSLGGTIAFKVYGPGGPSPTPTTATKPGDANGDNKVDETDYGIWRTNYNQTKTGGVSIGDFNQNGKVEGLDYVIWRNNYGK